MNKSLIILVALAIGIKSSGQQVPLSESYFIDRYSLSPSYAGNFNSKFLFAGFRSDWTGISGGPKTLSLSYNDHLSFMDNAGCGARILYDKAGIFNQIYFMGSYSYKLPVSKNHLVMFGLSMGVYQNSVNLLDYYNDPGYNIDPSLIGDNLKSKLKFMSNLSLVFKWKEFETGILCSNLGFGRVRYKEVDLEYNPLINFQFHSLYNHSLSDKWNITPLLILRGGKRIRTQFEIASQVTWQDRIMISLMYRDHGIFGFGFGSNIGRGLKIAYNFNLATNVTTGAFNNHEVTLGINLFDYFQRKSVPMIN